MDNAHSRRSPRTSFELYKAYSSVIQLVKEFATDRSISEILPSPTAPSFEYSPARTYFVGNSNEPLIVLPASNTFQKQVAALNYGSVYCIAACFRNEAGDRIDSKLHLFHQIELELVGATMPTASDTAIELLRHILRSFPAHLRVPRTDSLDEFELVDMATLSEVPSLAEYDEWCSRLKPSETGRLLLHTPPGHFPRMNRDVLGSGLSLSFDFLLPNGFGEVLSGGQRDVEHLRRYWGPQPLPATTSTLSGFGVGMERLLSWLLGERNLRHLRLPHFEQNIGFEDPNWW